LHLAALPNGVDIGESAAHAAMRRRILELELRCYMNDQGTGVTCGLLNDAELDHVRKATSGYTWNHESSPHVKVLHRKRATAQGLDPYDLVKGVSDVVRREQCIGDIEYHEQLQSARTTVRDSNSDAEWATVTDTFDSHTIRRTVHAMVITSAAGADTELFASVLPMKRKASYIMVDNQQPSDDEKEEFRNTFYRTVDRQYDVSDRRWEPGYGVQGRLPTGCDLMSTFKPFIPNEAGVFVAKRLPGVDDWDATVTAIRDMLFSRVEVERMWAAILGDKKESADIGNAYTFIAVMMEYATRLVISWLAVYHHSFYQDRVLAPMVREEIEIDAATGMRLAGSDRAAEESMGDADTATVDKWHPRVLDGVIRSIDRALRIARPLAHRPSFVCMIHDTAYARHIPVHRVPGDPLFDTERAPSDGAAGDTSICRIFKCPIHRHSITADVIHCDDPHAHRTVTVPWKLSDSNEQAKGCGRCRADMYLVSASIRCTAMGDVNRTSVPIGGVVYPGILAFDDCWVKPITSAVYATFSIPEVVDLDVSCVETANMAIDTPSTLRALMQGYLNDERVEHATLRAAVDALGARHSEREAPFTWDPYVY
jgi:hypothetical protein